VDPAEGPAGRVVVEVVRRGRFLVGEPFLTPGEPLTLGRRGSVAVAEGELVAVVPTSRGRARAVAVLGRPDDVHAVLRGIALEAGAERPFPRPVEEEVADLPRDPLPDDPARVDLRGLVSFTIDPPGAKDFDDALSVRAEAGGVRAWVHIADVSAFVAAGGPLDLEATRRATSVYLPGRVDPMLPPELSAGVCSLQPARDRWAVTVEIDPAGEAIAYRSVIRSRRRFRYDEVEDALAGRLAVDDELLEALRTLAGVAERLRAARRARGALMLALPELEFEFDDRGVADARLQGEPLAHALVEELMILANEHVARILAAARRPALYRVHEPPDPQSIELLVDRLEALDVPTPAMPELHTGAEAARYAAAVSERVAAYVAATGRGGGAFQSLVLRHLKQARYDPANLGHSGLASSAYCHFTSPIRRYPDLVCHRALLAHLGFGDDPGDADLEALAAHTSEVERDAARLERRGDDVCLASLLERRLFHRGWDEAYGGWVVGLIDGAAFVRFDDVFEGLLPARQLGGDHFDLDERLLALVGRSSGRRVRLGDPASVAVRSLDRAAGRVLLASPGPAEA
jgi:ribonuclease R